VRACGPVEKILLVTDGLSSYNNQALKVFREALHTGKVGRRRLVLGAGGVMIARVIKRCQRRRVVEVMRRVVAGREAEVISRVIATQRSIVALINTELTSSACRPPCAPGWLLWCAGAHKHCRLEAGIWLW
jgi:hypothetical protein